MNDHVSIHPMLKLAAAGALDAAETRRVMEHVRGCVICAREIEIWGTFAQGLQRQPQPLVPPHLLARTQARILRERGAAQEARAESLRIGAIAVFSWMVSLAFLAMARALTQGMFVVMGSNLVNPLPWFLVSSVVGGICAVSAAATLKSYNKIGRIL